MVDDCDLFTKLHAIEPEVPVIAIIDTPPLNLGQFILSELIPVKGQYRNLLRLNYINWGVKKIEALTASGRCQTLKTTVTHLNTR
jgi:hypothetical protein